MTLHAEDPRLALGRRLTTEVLAPLKAAFVGKDEVIDLLGVTLAAGENLFILGPPGTAKSALVQELAKRLDGRAFDYLLTRFTEPNELFGPFDIRKLREGELVTNTEGMLPEASLVFLDELLNANSAILNSLLTVLNERIFRRGRETRRLQLAMVVGASNRLPEDDALGALFDRFLLRVHCGNVPDERLSDVLAAGWRLDQERGERRASVTLDEVRQLQTLLGEVDLAEARPAYLEAILRLRNAGIPVSDRRAVKLQRPVAASALLCGRAAANRTDLWVLRHIWDHIDQQEVIAGVVQELLDKSTPAELATAHPRARGGAPDPQELAREFERLGAHLAQPALTAADRSVARDQLGLLAGRCAWVVDAQARTFLEQRAAGLWQQLGSAP